MYTIEEIASPSDFKGLQVGDSVFVADYHKQLIGNLDAELYACKLDSIDLGGSEFPFHAGSAYYRYAVKVHEDIHLFTKETFLPHADEWLRCKSTGDLYKPVRITDTYVVLDGMSVSYEQLFAGYVFNEDGSVCGVI